MTWATFWLYFGPVALVAAFVAVGLLGVALIQIERRFGDSK